MKCTTFTNRAILIIISLKKKCFKSFLRGKKLAKAWAECLPLHRCSPQNWVSGRCSCRFRTQVRMCSMKYFFEIIISFKPEETEEKVSSFLEKAICTRTEMDLFSCASREIEEEKLKWAGACFILRNLTSGFPGREQQTWRKKKSVITYSGVHISFRSLNPSGLRSM